ncbi:MAG: acylneuraminate cytidylyltransferase family protein [Oscillospiraceae bacterium]|jgi:CMP-N-acetylneuraminic acid synthetase|nr:acylneuraminate cytidylyltransferase family protein [Oscillospiraceae bacterium]
MYNNKTFLAIIPARSGSNGLKNKNIKLFAGKPLMYYSINQAINSNIFDAIFVSTNSQKYAQIAKNCGASVPFLRPEQLSVNTSLADEYIVNALENFIKIGGKFDYFAVLQPTSPLRTSEDIIQAADLLVNENLDSVVGVCQAEHPVQYYGRISEDLNMHNFSYLFNRQDFKNFYRINGAIYLCSCEEFLKKRTFYLKNSKAYIMDDKSSIDIDTQLDFEFAEFIYLKKNTK